MSDSIRMHEMPIYQADFATIIVRVELPDDQWSRTSALKITWSDLQKLSALRMPEDLKMMLDAKPDDMNVRIAFEQWVQAKKNAQNYAEYLGNKIAHHLILSIQGDE